MPRVQNRNDVPAAASNVVRRNRASPSRIVKLYKHLSDQQCKMIDSTGFGGLLKIACATIPAEFANWLLVDCFDAGTSQLVLPGRGRISLTADSVTEILGLPNDGVEVKYELDVEAINFMHEKYGLDHGTTLKIEAIVKRIKDNKEPDEDFLRSFLMLAVSTFLCPPTSLGISPRCYPPLVNLSCVKDLNWAQFVVDQFKLCATKMGKKDSVRVCLLVLVILYVDSVDVGNLEIPSTKPRVAAWSRKLIEEVIKLDTNRDGSFGKLKLKRSSYSTVHDIFFGSNDIEDFVSSKAPRGVSLQKKKKICAAVSRVLNGMTELLGTFVQEISGVEDEQESEAEARRSAEPEPSKRKSEVEQSIRRSKRQRTAGNGKSATYEATTSATAYEETTLGSDFEEDEEYEDYTTTDDSQGNADSDEDDDEEDGQSARHGDPTANVPSDDTSTHLQPIAEGNEEDIDEHGAGNEEDIDEHGADRDSEIEEVDSQDNEPLAARMRRMNDVHHQSHFQPIPLEVCPAEAPLAPPPAGPPEVPPVGPPKNPPAARSAAPPAGQFKDMFNNRRARLRLPEVVQVVDKTSKSDDSLHQGNHNESLNFTPPECNIMKFVDSSQAHHQGQANQNGNLGENSNSGSGSVCPLDLLDEDMLRKIEEEAIQEINSRKLNCVAGTSKSSPVLAASSSRTPPVGAAGTSMDPLQTYEDPASGNSSVTPAYQPPPRRQTRKAAVFRSPFVDIEATNLFKCNKAVNDIYNAVLAMASKGSSTRSSKKNQTDVIIINYWDFHITLTELVRSVKPGASLENVVAEIGLYVINPKGKKATKRVLPLRVSDHLQSGQLGRPAIRQVFRKGTNHLDHRQMIMFPVLQTIEGNNSEKIGHYFLLVLNLRNGRFEVLDSMRTLRDENLKSCCNNIIAAIKSLWKMYYLASKFDIDSYELVHTAVPLQNNNHDCGFHMLMHAEHWDGSTVYNFQEKDIPNIRKLLTYKWLTNEENDTDWKLKLGLS
ncbi:unnamed protein product [Urochloa humidicola]